MEIMLDELLNEDIAWVTECDGRYYVKLSKEMSDDTVWQVDINGGKAKYIQIVAYFMIINGKNPKELDPETFKKEMLM